MIFARTLAFILLLSSSAMCKAKEVELRLQVAGTIGIDETGAVDQHEIETELTPAIGGVVDRGVRQWRFEPIIENGRPVKARTRVTLNLIAVAHGEGYRLRIDDVHFGSLPSFEEQIVKHPIRYPKRALREGLGARVVLAARTDPSGKVVEVHPYQVSLAARLPERTARGWREEFYRAAEAAVSQWQFDPVELIDGAGAGNTLLVPFMFKLTAPTSDDCRERNHDAQWQAFVPGPIEPPPWGDGSTIAEEDLANLREDEALASSSRFVPTMPLVGSLL